MSHILAASPLQIPHIFNESAAVAAIANVPNNGDIGVGLCMEKRVEIGRLRLAEVDFRYFAEVLVVSISIGHFVVHGRPVDGPILEVLHGCVLP